VVEVIRRRFATFCLLSIQAIGIVVTIVGLATAQQESSAQSVQRQSLQDAWWTGPLLANSANTLPRGHFLVEPYIYDVIAPHSHAMGSRAYLEYGLADRFTVGAIPIVGYNKVDNGLSSSGMRFGDISLLAQYRLTTFREHRWVPTTAIQVQQAFPSGKYDRLGARPSDGLGAGAYTTSVALNSQNYFWLPNGRILRMRLDVAESFSNEVDVKDVSVYGTTNGFRGHAQPGKSLFVDAAGEYSVSKNWVLALDVIYQHTGDTPVIGTQNAKSVRLDSGSSRAIGFAPAVEYNVSPRIGVIAGVRVIAPGHNSSGSVAPVMAINIVH
jgi:Putative MetA-pathway of phenol degradation